MSVIVRDLTKRFGKRTSAAATNAVSFEAPTGKITSLLGPSGSGKTTVLRLVAGLEEPDAGEIRIDGIDVTRTPARERGVGFVFQGYALFSHMTVAANIAFGLSVRGTPKRECDARVAELLHLVKLEGYGTRYPHQLSGGQRQRIALARALAPRPRVLLLDEPFGALDARVRVELRDWLTELHERTGATILLVTHDQEEALELSQHVVLLSEGIVVQAGAPHDLYDSPKTPFVASFVGGSNVLAGAVERGHAKVGQLMLDVPSESRDGAVVTAYVRPHDVKVTRATSPSTSTATVERVTRVGGLVKLVVRLSTGEPLSVELPRAAVDALGLATGDAVHVELLRARVFADARTAP